MRRLLVLGGLLGLMLILTGLYSTSSNGAADPLTLAAIGFVVLASFTVGEIMTMLKLPRITGYILSGIIIGPYVSSVLSAPVVDDMKIFNDLALGLIAMTAGLELDIKAIRKVARTLIAIVAVKIPLMLVLAGGTFFVLESVFGFLDLGNSTTIAAVGVLIAVLGIGTSPSISLAVISESGAKGRLTDITLASAVFKDLVVVLALAVAIAVVRPFLEPGNEMNATAFIELGGHIGKAIVIGTCLGALLILFMRYVHREMLLAVVVAVLIGVEITHAWHAEFLLVFITGGFVVRTFSDFEHELLEPLVKVSLPIFVVFFTITGASLNLSATVQILPLALGVAVARAIAFYIASRVGTAVGGEAPRIRDNAWMALMPLAGVTIGLVGIARDQLITSVGETLYGAGIAIVAINLLVGPILMGIAFRRAGEVPGSKADEDEEVESGDKSKAEEPTVVEVPTPHDRLDAPELQAIVSEINDRIRTRLTTLHEEALTPLAERGRRLCVRLFVEPGTAKSAPADRIAEALSVEQPDVAEGLEDQIKTALEDLRVILQELPEQVTVERSQSLLLRSPADSFGTRVEKWVNRNIPFVGQRKRTIPVRVAARVALEARLVDALTSVTGTWFRSFLAMLAEARFLVTDATTSEECKDSLDFAVSTFLEHTQSDLDRTLARGLVEMSELFRTIGGPGAPASDLRLSETEPAVRRARQRLADNEKRWRALVDAGFDTLRAAAAVEQIRTGFTATLSKRVQSPLEIIADDFLPIAETLRGRLDVLIEDLQGSTPSARAEIQAAAAELYPKRERNRFRGLRAKYRHATQASDLLLELSALIEHTPKSLDLTEEAPETIQDPTRAEIQATPLARRAETILIDTFAPRLLEIVGQVSEVVVLGEARVEEAIDAATYGLDATEGDDDKPIEEKEWRSTALESMTRSRERLGAYIEELKTAREKAALAIDEQSSDSLAALQALVASSTRPTAIVRAGARETKRALGEVVDSTKKVIRRVRRQVIAAAVAIVRGRQVRDWLIRSGQTRLDATAMRTYLDRFVPEPSKLSLPPIYRKVFSLDPIEDLRLAVAYRSALEQLVRTIQPGKRENFANVLVVGENGSGRTSVINIIELRLARHRVIRIDPRFHTRRGGLLRAVANEIGAEPDVRSVTAALRRTTTVVLIDDLEHYVLPTPGGIEELVRFLHVVLTTSSYTHWVTSIGSSSLSLLDTMAPISAGFGRRMRLGRLSSKDVREVIETRTSLSGLDVEHQQRSFLGRTWRTEKAAEDYYRGITRVADGNLRAALLAHIRNVTIKDDGNLLASMPEGSHVPFGDQIPADGLAVLGMLSRFGPLTQVELAEGLAVSHAEAAGSILPLEDAGIVLRSGRVDRLRIPIHLDNAITTVLAKQGVLD